MAYLSTMRSYTIGMMEPQYLPRILHPRLNFLLDTCLMVENVKRDCSPTFTSSLAEKLQALHREIQTSQEMDATDPQRKVDEAVRAVDNFIEFVKKNDRLKPFVGNLEPSEFAKFFSYIRCLSKSLLSDLLQEPQRTSNIEWLLELTRVIVLELMKEIKPLPRILSTDQDIPIVCERSEVFYTTDRPLTVDCDYSGIPESRETLHYGKMVVSIPRDHERGGNLKEPQITDAQNYLEPFVHICEVIPFFGDREAFFRELNVYINEEARCPDVLIVIHGFNSLLKKNVRRLAKLKKDLDFEGAVILYSWSSAGEKLAYYSDEKTVCATTSLLYEFILNIQHKIRITSPRHTRPSRIHLMAHSMGNRALIGALRRIQNHVYRPLIGREDLPNISQVVFAAADVKVADFIDLVEGFGSDSQDAKIPILTVYCSSDDFALMLSDVHCEIRNQEDYVRLGDTQSCIESSDKLDVHFVDVVDATGVGTSTLQHSYYCEVPTVLDDLKDIFQGGRRPPDRQRLQQLQIPPDSTDPFIMYAFNPGQFCRRRWEYLYESVSGC